MNPQNIKRLELAKAVFQAFTENEPIIMPEDLESGKDYFVFRAVGECMNSPVSPMQLKEGDYYLAHRITPTAKELTAAEGKVIAFMLKDGRGFGKELVKVADMDADGIWLVLRFYEPKQTDFLCALADVESVFLIDKVLGNDSESGKEQAE